MFLPRAALNNPQFSIVIILLSSILGVMSYFSMPRSEDPQFDLAIVLVEVIYPGASPLDIETLVVDPLEAEISELEDIDKITTTINDGGTRLEIRFLYGTDPDDAYDDVVRVVSSIKPTFPEGVEASFVFKGSPTSVNILQFALWTDPVDYKRMGFYAERLEKRLEQFPQVRKADIWGLPIQIVEVQLDPGKLLQFQLSVQQVLEAITNRGENITPGFVDIQQRRFNLRASGNYDNLEQVNSTVVKVGDHSPIRVGDIANVSFTSDQPTYLAYYQDRPVIFMSVEQHAGTNIFDVTESLLAEVERFKSTIPEDIEIESIFIQAESVEKRVDGFFNNLLQGLVLVAIMSMIFLGFRESFIITLTVPISFMIAIGWLDFAGFGLEQMSIVGLIIALGLLVDDAIVVTESIHRVKGESTSIIDAAMKGASRVGWASTSGSITTMLAFLPMLLLASDSGDFMRSMPVTVVLVLTASLLIGLTLTPLMAAILLPKKSSKYTLQHFTEKFAQSSYRGILDKLVSRPVISSAVALVVLVGLLSLFPKVGVSLFPKAEKPMMLVNIEAPNNTSLYETDRIVAEISGMLKEYDLVKDMALNVGNANPRIYYNETPRRGEANYGQILVLLEEYEDSAVTQLITDLRTRFAEYSFAEVTVREFQQGPVTDPPITFRLVGENLENITAVATALEQKMLETTGIVNIENNIAVPQVEYKLAIDYDRAALAGIDIAILEQTVKTMMSGTATGVLKDEDGQDYPVVVQSRNPELPMLEQLRVTNAQGSLVPISQFVKMEYATGAQEFYHYQKIRTAKVTGDAGVGYSVNELTTQIIEYLENTPMPNGVTFEVGGEEETRQQNFDGLAQVMLISAVGIFAVLVLQFKSMLQPAVIFTSVPFAIGGAAMGLLLSGYSFSIMAFVGLISLFGIVVNNAIMLVDTCNYNIREGQAKEEAVVNASATRFTPILLTTFTTIGGLIPLTLFGGNLWAPLGWVIIGGLSVSTLSSLLVVPVFTSLMTRKSAQ